MTIPIKYNVFEFYAMSFGNPSMWAVQTLSGRAPFFVKFWHLISLRPCRTFEKNPPNPHLR